MRNPKDLPILMKPTSVVGLLGERKTQTRRLLKSQPRGGLRSSPFAPSGWEDIHGYPIHCKYVVGDRLWVREAYWLEMDSTAFEDGETHYASVLPSASEGFSHYYCATDPDPNGREELTWTGTRFEKKSPLFMPRHLSRILLEVTDLRFQQLQNITEADAIAEGVEPLFTPHQVATVPGLHVYRDTPMPYKNYLWHGDGIGNEGSSTATSAVDSYRSLWETMHGKSEYAWEYNPWVLAITVRKIAP